MIDLLWKLLGKLKGYIQYSLVGLVGFGVHLVILWFLTDKLHVWYMLSAAIAITIAALNNYILNYLWTFKDKKGHINNKFVGYLKYLVGRGFTEGLYLALLYVMVDIGHVHYMTSAIVVQMATAFIGYLIALKWIWRKKYVSKSVKVEQPND